MYTRNSYAKIIYKALKNIAEELAIFNINP